MTTFHLTLRLTPQVRATQIAVPSAKCDCAFHTESRTTPTTISTELTA